MFTTRKGLLLIIILFLFSGGLSSLGDWFDFSSNKGEIQISEDRRDHILHGDERGGGHLAGTNKPCKSEFPDDWNSDKIISEIQTIAANDNLNWKRQDNGYYKVEKMVEDVRVRVIVNRRSNEVVTAYPVNTGRNPCPKPANDN